MTKPTFDIVLQRIFDADNNALRVSGGGGTSSAWTQINDTTTSPSTGDAVTITTITTSTNQVTMFDGMLMAKRTDTAGFGGVYRIYGGAKNDAGTVTVNYFKDVQFEDDPNYDVVVTTSGTDIIIQVNGVLNHTLSWEGIINYKQL